MKNSFMDYAMSVIVARALPDARDGLKPVHRRILFAQRGLNNTCNRPYLKCARIVGDVIGKYHPHGDSVGLRRPGPHGPGLLDALHARRRPGQLRLGRRRSAGGHALHRVPDDASSPRELLADIDKETVDWQPNYDDKELEPTVLPTKVPNLLINGAIGHRRRHGDQHPAAQPRRDHRRRRSR